MNIINVPNLNFINALNLCHELQYIDLNSDYLLNFENTHVYDPFPMLIFSASIRKARSRHQGKLMVQNCNNSYSQHMGFFKSFGANIGKKPGEANGNINYLPIDKLEINNLQRKSAEKVVEIQNVIEDEAKRMAKVISRGNKEIENPITFLLLEMIRNVPEHSNATDIWYCAQYWPTYDLVELAIIDEGCGIKNSLITNNVFKEIIKTDKDALEWALKPGISKSFKPYNPPKSNAYDYWQNSGYGLYMVSRLCTKLGGSFVVASGDSAVIMSNSEEGGERRVVDTAFAGTAVQMRIKPSRLRNYKTIHKAILADGEIEAQKDKLAFKTASKPSRGYF
ncbi:ATP-binding protein [Ruminiclostridium cellobioparum]|uniref:ATP-binding protein n=1 Tax=Ruminiclostridium cellobioparum TaxID=29355 RepID=UPI0028ADAC3F|nr:ATP-binding protein [Ruminiclostridium cellobioparum]